MVFCGDGAATRSWNFFSCAISSQEQTPAGLSDAFANEKATQRRAFLARARVGAAPATLIEVREDLRAFLLPMLARKKLAWWPTIVVVSYAAGVLRKDRPGSGSAVLRGTSTPPSDRPISPGSVRATRQSFPRRSSASRGWVRFGE
jgi:hypothetical protein